MVSVLLVLGLLGLTELFGSFEVLGLLGLLELGLFGLGVMLLSVTPVRGCPPMLVVSVVLGGTEFGFVGFALGVLGLLLIPLLAEVSPTVGPRIEVSRAMPLFIELVSVVIAPPPLTEVVSVRWIRVRRAVPVRVVLRVVVVVLLLTPVSVTPGRT